MNELINLLRDAAHDNPAREVMLQAVKYLESLTVAGVVNVAANPVEVAADKAQGILEGILFAPERQAKGISNA